MSVRLQVEGLRARLNDFGADDDRYEIEREMLEGLEAVSELAAAVSARGLTPIPTGHRAVGRDRCFFSAPASLPDDPAQPSGTFLLTEARAVFVGGPRSLAVPWHGVSRCLRLGRNPPSQPKSPITSFVPVVYCARPLIAPGTQRDSDAEAPSWNPSARL